MENLNLYIEIVAVITGLIYLFLMINEKIACWIFGIISSLLSIYLFVETKLYSEAILYTYYVVMGVYGWMYWSKKKEENKTVPVKRWAIQRHILLIILGVLLSFGLGSAFSNYTDAEAPFLDAFSTIFAFIATYLEAQKVLEGWVYWILLNGFSVYLYSTRGLDIY
ncbi:MAG: nicotinamide riboside transporter PnuC, partial [Chitinophagales bacterium]